MPDRSALEAAAAAGVINADQVAPLHDFLTARATTGVAPLRGEEDLRFIRNFHDVFLMIGIILFAFGLAFGVAVFTADRGVENAGQGAILMGSLYAGCAAVLWLLGEVFARRRRLFLPAIAIVIAFTIFIMFAAALLYAGVVLGRAFDENAWDLSSMPPEVRTGILIAVGCAVIAPLAFYLRFRLPFSLGMTGAAIAAFIVVVGLVSNFELTIRFLPAIYLLLGAALFIAGVWFDSRDPARSSRFSDNGFWLHFAAAPLILNGAFGLIGMAFGVGATSPAGGLVASASEGGAGATVHAMVALAVVLGLGIISLLINRRVLVVSALITTGVAIGILMNAAGFGEGALAAGTLTVLGAFVLILGASWHGARRALLGWVKPDGVWARIFPPETVAG